MSFAISYKTIMVNEGGYANDPDDPGGETYKGIARKRWSSWKGWSIIDAAFLKTGLGGKAIEKILNQNPILQEEVRDFYKTHFWDSIWGDQLDVLSPELATDMFDMSVNLGTGRATEFIQRACNALNNRGLLYPDIQVDMNFGPITYKAVLNCVNSRGVKLLYKVVNILQGAYYISLMESNPKFEKYVGWFHRVDFLQE
jgi:type VI secretion system secreted protein VgrG